MEWYDALDNIEHTRLKKFMGDLRHVCIKEFGVNPSFFITCCSRVVPGKGQKDSYHIVVGNIAFECNHDGKMKQFLQIISGSNNWQVNQADVIDWKVYNDFRSFRLPLCSKKGSVKAMVCITINPLQEVYLSHAQAKDPENWSSEAICSTT